MTGQTVVEDRNAEIRRRFDERRRAALRDAVTPETIDEFCSDVIGRKPRTLALRHLLNFMRMAPIEGRTFAYAAPSYESYYLARLHAERGVPPTVDTSRTFRTKEDAIAAAFLERAHEITGIGSVEADNI
ncbi:hypothetical protein [Mycolicibacterium baixiangningiae]|uniref:hypothetical protein n=1 Tax=Mycolicibacterium baixiangningiae TaxID=2761578 RepID=UPI0018E5D3AE|nr:hypothetical protein [Mycolicibacterium baixiangningiae]